MERALNPNAVDSGDESSDDDKAEGNDNDDDDEEEEAKRELQELRRGSGGRNRQQMDEEIQDLRRIVTPTSSSGRASVGSMRARDVIEEPSRTLTPRSRRLLEHDVEEFPNLLQVLHLQFKFFKLPTILLQLLFLSMSGSLSASMDLNLVPFTSNNNNNNNPSRPTPSAIGMQAMRRVSSVPAPVALAAEDSYKPTAFGKNLEDLISVAQQLHDSSLDELIKTSAKMIAKLQKLCQRWQEKIRSGQLANGHCEVSCWLQQL